MAHEIATVSVSVLARASRVGIVLAALCGAAGPSTAADYEDVRLPWTGMRVQQFSDHAATGELSAKLAKPAALPAPFVVFLHNCSGLKLDAVGHWVDFFVKRGIGVLMVDSLTPRKRAEACSDAGASWARRRADDIASALAWLRVQPFVRADRVALMGQSQGATATLLAANRQAPSSRDIVGAVALYPGCVIGVAGRLQFDKPLIVMVGDEDTWTPAANCRELKELQADGEMVELIVYGGARHSFDNPGVYRLALGKYPIGEHAASRDRARERVARFIEERLR